MTDTAPDEILPGLPEPARTLEDLYEQRLPSIAAHIWHTCCWPDRMADGWRMGDYRFVVFSIRPEPGVELYVQFWSEPKEPVLVEVCSGEWAPMSVKYVQRAQRGFLRSLGYEMGGEASNFQKELRIEGVAAAEDAAREALRILFEAFGYRGQSPIEVRAESGGRAEASVVYDALTPEDVAKLLGEEGYRALVTEEDDGAPIVLVRRGRLRFAVRFDAHREGSVFAAVVLNTLMTSARDISPDLVAELSAQLFGLTVLRNAAREVRLSMLLRLDGGVTAAWISESIRYWHASLSRCRRLLRPGERRRGSAVTGLGESLKVH
jgi:hypothetical protein